MQRCCARAHVFIQRHLSSQSQRISRTPACQRGTSCISKHLLNRQLNLRRRHKQWGFQRLERHCTSTVSPILLTRYLNSWNLQPHLAQLGQHFFACKTVSPHLAANNHAGSPCKSRIRISSLPAGTNQSKAPGCAGRVLDAHIGY
jgi:hypothetical protein